MPQVAAKTATCAVSVVRLERVRPAQPPVPTSRATVAGLLTFARLDVEIDGATLQESLAAVARALHLNLVGIYQSPNGGAGLDRTAPVYLSLHDVTGIEAIEQILGHTGSMIESTWQIRGSIIECGPKSVLAEPNRREVRVHDITDLRFEAPTFPRPDDDEARLRNRRRTPKEVCADLALMIVNTVEPRAWDEPPLSDEQAFPTNTPAAPSATAPSTAAPKPSTPPVPARNLDGRSEQDIYVRGQWATMQFRNDRTLVISAPDFIHRQLSGLGEMIPPLPLDK